MQHIIEGNPKNARGRRIAIVVSRFNELVTKKLLAGCQEALAEYGCGPEHQTVAWVPGSFELPFLAQKLAETGRYQALICLGAVIRGETYHFELVAQGAAQGIQAVALKTGIPVVMGVITTENLEQALARAGTRSGNKGWEAALTALEMIDALHQE
jgi:6,7-dimethyl-8-ribityllumazine synthase